MAPFPMTQRLMQYNSDPSPAGRLLWEQVMQWINGYQDSLSGLGMEDDDVHFPGEPFPGWTGVQIWTLGALKLLAKNFASSFLGEGAAENGLPGGAAASHRWLWVPVLCALCGATLSITKRGGRLASPRRNRIERGLGLCGC